MKLNSPTPDEKWNVLTHALGIILSLIGTPFLLLGASNSGEPLFFWAGIIYTISLLMVYCSSTIYHWESNPVQKKKLRKWDHVSIYFLIAGSYTPFLFFKYSQNSKALIFILIMWGLALLGSTYKLFVMNGNKWISAGFYVLMGWMAIFFGKGFFSGISNSVITLIIAGGVLYSIGVIFYMQKKMPYSHAVWHLFVVSASICHFLAIYEVLT